MNPIALSVIDHHKHGKGVLEPIGNVRHLPAADVAPGRAFEGAALLGADLESDDLAHFGIRLRDLQMGVQARISSALLPEDQLGE